MSSEFLVFEELKKIPQLVLSVAELLKLINESNNRISRLETKIDDVLRSQAINSVNRFGVPIPPNGFPPPPPPSKTILPQPDIFNQRIGEPPLLPKYHHEKNPTSKDIQIWNEHKDES